MLISLNFGKWNNHHFLVLVDAFSKWPKVKVTSTTASELAVLKPKLVSSYLKQHTTMQPKILRLKILKLSDFFKKKFS